MSVKYTRFRQCCDVRGGGAHMISKKYSEIFELML